MQKKKKNKKHKNIASSFNPQTDRYRVGVDFSYFGSQLELQASTVCNDINTFAPTVSPTIAPVAAPTPAPTKVPTLRPTAAPTYQSVTVSGCTVNIKQG